MSRLQSNSIESTTQDITLKRLRGAISMRIELPLDEAVRLCKRERLFSHYTESYIRKIFKEESRKRAESGPARIPLALGLS